MNIAQVLACQESMPGTFETIDLPTNEYTGAHFFVQVHSAPTNATVELRLLYRRPPCPPLSASFPLDMTPSTEPIEDLLGNPGYEIFASWAGLSGFFNRRTVYPSNGADLQIPLPDSLKLIIDGSVSGTYVISLWAVWLI